VRLPRSITFKIGATIVAIELLSFVLIGIYYTGRFGQEIDKRVETALALPAALMGRGLLTYDSVSNLEKMSELVGEEMVQALIIDRSGRVVYSSHPDYLERRPDEIPGLQLETTADAPRSLIEVFSAIGDDDHYRTSYAPLELADGRLIGHLYLKARTTQLDDERERMFWTYAVSLGACLVLTTLAIVISFHSMFSRRIQGAVNTLHAVERGNLESRIDNISGEDEVGRLERGINAMIDEIARREAQEKRTQETLRAEERRYRGIVEDQTELICRTTPDGQLTFVNGAFCRYFQREPRELEGSSILPFVPASQRDALLAHLESLSPDNPVASHEHSVITSEGAVRWHQWTHRGAFDESGHVYEIQGVGRDVTERKRLEEELRQSQKMEAVGRLAGGIAHDFNNLLTAINGYAEFLLDELESEDLRSHAEEISNAGRRAAALTRQLLVFSRRQVLQPQVLDPNEIIVEMDRLLRRVIGEDIELVTILDESLVRVAADRSQLEQIIVNLAVNARDAMQGGGKITIETSNVLVDPSGSRAHRDLAPGSYALIAITDTGCGMDEQTQARIFEPFFTTKGEDGGTGLGLSTVYGIVAQSGGEIRVHSEPGQGARFEIFLPRTTASAEKGDAPESESTPPTGGETILLVEDEHSVRRLARRVLSQEGYRLHVAEGPQEALEIAERLPGAIDLLLTDVVMPGMTGPELARVLTASRPEMKVLYVSGYSTNPLEDSDGSVGHVAFLAKPFTPQALVARVRELLSRFFPRPPAD
jgi:PAS domain S-box-containing protein